MRGSLQLLPLCGREEIPANAAQQLKTTTTALAVWHVCRVFTYANPPGFVQMEWLVAAPLAHRLVPATHCILHQHRERAGARWPCFCRMWHWLWLCCCWLWRCWWLLTLTLKLKLTLTFPVSSHIHLLLLHQVALLPESLLEFFLLSLQLLFILRRSPPPVPFHLLQLLFPYLVLLCLPLISPQTLACQHTCDLHGHLRPNGSAAFVRRHPL